MLCTHKVLLEKLKQKEEELQCLHSEAILSDTLINGLEVANHFNQDEIELLKKYLRFRVQSEGTITLKIPSYRFFIGCGHEMDKDKILKLIIKLLKFLAETFTEKVPEGLPIVQFTLNFNDQPNMVHNNPRASMVLDFYCTIADYDVLVSLDLTSDDYKGQNFLDLSVIHKSPRLFYQKFSIPKKYSNLFLCSNFYSSFEIHTIEYSNFSEMVNDILGENNNVKK